MYKRDKNVIQVTPFRNKRIDLVSSWLLRVGTLVKIKVASRF